MSHRYYYLLRPFGIGCQPDGWIVDKDFNQAVEVWQPKRVIPEGQGRTAHGWIEYPEPLTFDQIWRFDLFPADPVAEARYSLWVLCDRDAAEAQIMLDDYLSQGDDWLKDHADRDLYAQIALTIGRD